MKVYLELNEKYTKDGTVHANVSFIPIHTINCNPPYVKGVKDSCWVKYGKNYRIKSFAEAKNDFKKASQLVGMSVMEIK